jgi:ADP-ribosylglycohydrolase
MPFEGWKPSQIRRYYGRITEPIQPAQPCDGSGEPLRADEDGRLKDYNIHLMKGEYTDDTVLSLALARSLVDRRGIDISDIASQQAAAYNEFKQEHGEKNGFGPTTRNALERILAGTPHTDSGVIGGPGNGPAMKMAPLGVYMHAKGRYSQGLAAAKAIGEITHQDTRSIASGVVQAHAIYAALSDFEKNDFLDSLVQVCERFEQPPGVHLAKHEDGMLLDRLRWVADNAEVSAQAAHDTLKSSSPVYKSYPFALFMFQKYWDDPLVGLLDTVNYGGDCDTTGAIFGNLAGARHGVFFPQAWLKVLKDSEQIATMADAFAK